MRAAVGGFFHETNTFCAIRTDLDSFKARDYIDTDDVKEFTEYFNDAREITGFLRTLAKYNDDVLPLPAAFATLSGLIEKDVYVAIKERMLERIAFTKPDVVFLNLHGAAVVEGFDDCEGDLLSSIKALVGEGTPIYAVLDLHANVSPLMVKNADLLLGYNTEPHVDIRKRESECVEIYHRQLEEGFVMKTAYAQPPLLLPAINTDTNGGAMTPFIAQAFEYEKQAGVINVSPFAGFYGSDKYNAGPSIICTVTTDVSDVQAICNDISNMFIDKKDSFFVHLDPLDKIISTIKSAPSKKYAVIDECDDPLGGGPADGTYILDKLIEGGINKIGVSTICDREITEMAFAAGEGAVIKGILGGKTDNKHGRPLPITAVVTKLICKPIPMCEANGEEFADYGETYTDYGRIAVISTEQADIVVTENKVPTEMINIFRHLDIDSNKYSVLVLKGFGHSYKANFSDKEYVYFTAESIGVNNPDVTKIGEFKKIRRPVYPLDMK